MSESADQLTSSDCPDAQPQTPAIKLRIKIGQETVIGGTKRCMKVNLLCVFDKQRRRPSDECWHSMQSSHSSYTWHCAILA